ncbi:hypothetical protein KAR91_16840 [Candidatus Pacearchaeota archaeon]|nr:hypothetical protein [Candidatus Pacearchaeota archaeon]
MSWGDVTFLYDSVGPFIATSEEADFEAVNLSDGLDSTHWTATSTATQELIYDAGFGNTITFDYMALGAGHNLSGATVTVKKSSDASSYSDVVTGFVVSDNKSLAKFFTEVTDRAVKIVISGASIASYVTALHVGSKVELAKAGLYDPYRRKRDSKINYTESGRVAGAVINFTERKLKLKFKTADSTLYDKIDAWWETQGLKVFFMLWEPIGHSTDVYPVISDDKTFNAPFTVSGVFRNATVSLRGLQE